MKKTSKNLDHLVNNAEILLICFSLHHHSTFKACPPLILSNFSSTIFKTIIQHQCLKKKQWWIFIVVESWLTDQLSGEVDDLVFIIVQESILLSKEIFLTPDDSGLKI